MTSDHVPQLFAVTAEPRMLRAGETAIVTFRTPNLGAEATPAGTVTFVLDERLVPLDRTDVRVEPVGAGEHVVATIRVRAPATIDDRSALDVKAVLALPGAAYETNVCAIVVRSRPRLDGPDSGTFVEAIDRDTVRVRAIVANDGDGPARGVRLHLPAPRSCARADGGGGESLSIERLDPGERTEVSFDARIVTPSPLIAAIADVHTAAGTRVALPVRTTFAPDPDIQMPIVSLEAARRRVDVTIDVPNAGWTDAHDVRVRIASPSVLRLIDGSVTVDGVPAGASRRPAGATPVARIERDRGGCAVVIADVPARTTAAVRLALAAPLGASGAIEVGCERHDVAASFAPAPGDDLRVRLLGHAPIAAPGEHVRIAAGVVNAGDAPVAVHCVLDGADDALPVTREQRTVAPCSHAVLESELVVPHDAADGDVLERALIVADARRERAHLPFAVQVRDLRTAAAGEPARDDDPTRAAIAAQLEVPDAVAAGAPFAVRLALALDAPAERIAIRIPAPPGARYVAGSTIIDGRAYLDRVDGAAGDGSPFAGDGLQLRGIAAGTRIDLGCAFVAHTPCEGALSVDARVESDASARAECIERVRILPREPFAAGSAAGAYHVEGHAAGPLVPSAPGAIDAPIPEPVASSAPAPSTSRIVLDGERLDAIARLHRALRGDGLVAHLFALRLFFPDAGHAASAAALRGVREALAETFDRLYVKLRIPGFDVSAYDLDDEALREALRGLPAGASTAFGGGASPAMLRELVRLVGAAGCDDARLADAIRAHANALDGVLAAYEGLPLEIFDDALARRDDRALDDARAAVLEALAPYVGRAAGAC